MNAIESYRREHSLTYRQIADRVGANAAQIFRWAKGTRTIPAEKAMILHNELGIPLGAMRPDLWPEAAPGRAA